MAKKKEKKIPEKQLMFEQMLTQQLYGGQPSREEGIAKLQSEYDAWNARQDGIAKLQSDYDNWLNEQQKAQQPVETPKVETVEAPKVAPVQKTVAKKTQPTQAPVSKEEKKYLTHADIIPSLTKANVDNQKELNERRNEVIGNSVKQLDLSKYDLPTSNIDKSDFVSNKTQEKAKIKEKEKTDKAFRQIQNDYVMSKEELKEAKATAKKELKKLNKDNLTPEEQTKKDIYTSLKKKTSALDAAWKGVRKIPFGISKFLANAGIDLYQTVAEPVAGALDDITGSGYDRRAKVREAAENDRRRVNENYQYLRGEEKEAQAQHPGAYGAGNAATQMAMYYVTNPMFDAVGKGLGVTNKAAQFALNQAGQAAQDAALDIYPAYREAMEDGTVSEEEKKELARMGITDVGMNLAIPALQYGLGKSEQVLYDQLGKTVENDAGILKSMDATGALREAKDAAKQIPELKATKSEPNEIAKFYDDMGEYTIEPIPTKSNFELPQETFDKLDSNFEELARPLNEVQNSGIMNSVTDEKALKEWANVNEAYSDYLNKSMFGENIEEIEAAKKTLDNARKRYARAMKDIDPEVSQTFNSGSFGYKIGRPLNERNVNAVSKQGQEAVDAINELENIGTNMGAGEVELRGKRPYAKTQGVSPAIENEAKRLAEAMDAEELAEQAAKPVEQGIDNAARNLSVEEVNLKGGKKGYYVAENSGSVSRNIENGKVYKTPEEAQEALENMAKEQPAPKAPEAVSEPIPRNVEELEPSVEDMVESGQSRHIRGAGEMQMEGVSDEVVADFQDNPQMHSVLRNADTKAKAENIYNTSNNPEVEFRDMLRQHDPAALPLGHQIAKDYSAAGNHEAAAQIYREMGEQLTKAGQFSQAAVINMMKNDPLTALQYAQRQIDTLNQQGLKRFGSKWNDFKLTDDEIKLFDNIAPGDEDAIKAAYDIIGERLGKEYPTSFMDKLLEGRKIAMLFNVRTNVRNFGANVPTLGMRWAADRVEALGQNVVHLINPNFKVTQAVTGSGIQGRRLATEAFNSPRVQTMLEGTSGKYEIPDLKNSLVKNKQMYKGNRLEKWIDNLTGGGIQKINEKLFGKKGVQSGLETIRNATYKMLDLGDSPFVKENFVERLGSYINAQKIKNLDDIPDEAIEMAWEEAMKATYKDESWAVKMLSKIKGGIESVPHGGRAFSQAAIPFLQAPGNIAARMVDYSPVRGSKGVADIISGAHANDLQKVARGIEEASKGLTGTGMVLLGMKLRESGILTGTYSKDKDQKAFEKQNGFKEFALHIGDKYFTYDWAQPFAQSLITGTLLEDAIEKSDEYNSDLLAYIDEKAGTNFNGSMASKNMGVAGEAAKASLNSWFNASPLQGLQELLRGNYTDQEDIASSIMQTLGDDFVGAFVPSAVNAVAKSVDPVQRNATDKTNSTATFVNQQIAKIPGLSKTLPAKYDTWGREMKYADNKAMATASRFVIPGDYSYDKSDKVDREIDRLYKASNNAAVFPQVAPTKVNGETLNNKEVSEYQKDMGERSHQFVEELISTDFYKGMTNKDMAETVSKLYGVSKALTERDKFGKELADSSEYKKPIAEYDNAGGGKEGAKAVIKYYQGKQIASEAGISANSKAYESIQNNIKQGNTDAAKKVAESEKQAKDAFVEYGVENNSTSRKIYEKYGSTGLKDLSEFQKKGLGATATYTYQSAKKEVGNSIPSITDFATTYNKIDTSRNGSIDQKEFKKYLNRINPSQEEAERLATIYGDWKHAPKLNKKGEWYFPTK